MQKENVRPGLSGSASTESPQGLKRAIGKWDLVLMIINSIIGAGIFGLPSRIYQLTGVYSILAFFVCAAIVLVFILCFAEVGSRFQTTGGPYTYVLAAFGKLPAFTVGWLLLLSRIFNYATLINLLVTYMALFYPALTDAVPRALTILTVTGGLTYINHVGAKSTTRLSNVLTIAKLVPLALFILVGMFFLQADAFEAAQVPAVSDFSSAILLLIFAFGGFESVLVNTGEIRQPSRIIPFGLLTATTIVAIFYVLIQITSIGTLPALASSERPLADAATQFVGPAGGKLIAAGALISILGTLNILLFSGSRLPFAFSQEGQFPKPFAAVHRRYHTPTLSLLSVAVVTAFASIAWSFLTALQFAVIIRVSVYLFVCASLLQLRKKSPDQGDHFKLKGGTYFAGAGILLCLWLLSTAKLVELRNVAILLSAGILIYFLQTKKVSR
ncbi:amino acid permease [Flavisolibacter sp. BT320]|nr:amino acid permease [Flavisolibacter longurius]